MIENPFREPADQNVTPAIIRRRIKFLKNWIGDFPKGTKILDIGEPNSFTKTLVKEFGVEIANTEGDFNFPDWTPKDKFQIVFCFEVVEHLMNPLLFLKTLRERMHEGGVLYLTCPKPSFRFLQMDFHFNEMDERRLRALFTLSGGFRIEESGTTKSAYPWFIFWRGFRPLCRWFFQKTYYIKAIAV